MALTISTGHLAQTLDRIGFPKGGVRSFGSQHINNGTIDADPISQFIEATDNYIIGTSGFYGFAERRG